MNEKLNADGTWSATNNAPWKLVDELKGFNWLDYYGGKFSTSQNRGVFMDQALELLPADYWRWWITANTPETSDATFAWEQFQAQVNADLADVLGNFVNRILKFTETRFDGVVPGRRRRTARWRRSWQADVLAKLRELTEHMEDREFRKASAALRQLWVLGNQYLTEAAPWTALKTDRERAARGRAHRPEPGGPVRQGRRAVHPVRRRDHRAVGRRELPGPVAARWTARRCCDDPASPAAR